MIIRLERWGVYFYEKNLGYVGIGCKALANFKDYGGRVDPGYQTQKTIERDHYNCKTNQIINEMPESYQKIAYYEFAYHHFDDGNQYTHKFPGDKKNKKLKNNDLYNMCDIGKSEFYRRRTLMLEKLNKELRFLKGFY